MNSEPIHSAQRVITLGNGVKIGGGHFLIMAGPCAVESEEQIISIACDVKAAGAQVLRGGAFKPRTSPMSFQGLGVDGLRLLLRAKVETGLPIVTEILDVRHLPLFEAVDIIRVGTRNMFNYELLKELGKIRKPVLLKRGMAATIKEFLLSAEYILAGGNDQVILCERGIRSFDAGTRNVLDVCAVPRIHEAVDIPVIVDPSHGTGRRTLVRPMAVAAAAAGADGLMIEVHNDPDRALSDGQQSITGQALADLLREVEAVRQVTSKLQANEM